MPIQQLTSDESRKIRIWVFAFLGTFVIVAVMVLVFAKDPPRPPPPAPPASFIYAVTDARASADGDGANKLGYWLAGHKVGWSELAANQCVTGEVAAIALDDAVLHAGRVNTADGEVAVIATGNLSGITPGGSGRLCGALVGDTLVGEFDTPYNNPPAEQP
jgi:hypothetical protein